MDYINVQGATDYFGNTDWAVKETPERCVRLANLWLSRKGLPDLDLIPEEWKEAGYEIAFEIGKGGIYADKQTGVLSESMSADTVSYSQTLASNAVTISKGELIANDLLKPWLKSFGLVNILNKIP